MRSRLILLTGALLGMNRPAKAAVVWSADLEGQMLGSTSGRNRDLGSSQIQTANGLSGEVVKAPGGLTHLTGKVLLPSAGDNGFEAFRPENNVPIDLAPHVIAAVDACRLSPPTRRNG